MAIDKNNLPTPSLDVQGARVLILRDDADQKIGSIIIPEKSQEKPKKGYVVKTGPGARTAAGIMPLEVKRGDSVLYRDFAGHEVQEDGQTYVIMNEADILAVVGE